MIPPSAVAATPPDRHGAKPPVLSFSILRAPQPAACSAPRWYRGRPPGFGFAPAPPLQNAPLAPGSVIPRGRRHPSSQGGRPPSPRMAAPEFARNPGLCGPHPEIRSPRRDTPTPKSAGTPGCGTPTLRYDPPRAVPRPRNHGEPPTAWPRPRDTMPWPRDPHPTIV